MLNLLRQEKKMAEVNYALENSSHFLLRLRKVPLEDYLLNVLLIHKLAF